MIGKKLKEVRTEKNYSLTRLAKEAGVSKSYLSYLERDLRNNPSVHFLTKIAETLDIPLNRLLETSTAQGNNGQNTDTAFMELFKKEMKQNDIQIEDLEEFRAFITFKNWLIDNKRKRK